MHCPETLLPFLELHNGNDSKVPLTLESSLDGKEKEEFVGISHTLTGHLEDFYIGEGPLLTVFAINSPAN